ncbi:MAG: hypothetical protein AAB592_00930 [Patescibacteria group bacterium]
MKLKFLILVSLILSLLTFYSVSFATTGVATTYCPAEAQAIVDAVGGCPAIDCKKYETVCQKCGCSEEVTTTVTTTTVTTDTTQQKSTVKFPIWFYIIYVLFR